MRTTYYDLLLNKHTRIYIFRVEWFPSKYSVVGIYIYFSDLYGIKIYYYTKKWVNPPSNLPLNFRKIYF